LTTERPRKIDWVGALLFHFLLFFLFSSPVAAHSRETTSFSSGHLPGRLNGLAVTTDQTRPTPKPLQPIWGKVGYKPPPPPTLHCRQLLLLLPFFFSPPILDLGSIHYRVGRTFRPRSFAPKRQTTLYDSYDSSEDSTFCSATRLSPEILPSCNQPHAATDSCPASPRTGTHSTPLNRCSNFDIPGYFVPLSPRYSVWSKGPAKPCSVTE
jgi:hypothetical protein